MTFQSDFLYRTINMCYHLHQPTQPSPPPSVVHQTVDQFSNDNCRLGRAIDENKSEIIYILRTEMGRRGDSSDEENNRRMKVVKFIVMCEYSTGREIHSVAHVSPIAFLEQDVDKVYETLMNGLILTQEAFFMENVTHEFFDFHMLIVSVQSIYID